ncbi:MAG TPA: hypothetical protein VFG89_02995 [Coriobacteriia bacterium]|nr:hypothetical protein [Coriobacteriia bacterium]
MTSARKFDGQTLAITCVYSAAWALMLFNGGLYWDDWCLTGLSWKGAVSWGAMNGQFWQPVYWVALGNMRGGWYLGHALTFVLFLASALFLNRILRRVAELSPVVQWMVPLVFAVFPVNAARIAHIDLQYTVSVAVFYYAWLLLAQDLENPRLPRRIVSAALFVFAMLTTKSLLMFFALVGIYLLWQTRAELRDGRSRTGVFARYAGFAVLPFASWFIQLKWLAPSGLYAGYNEITAEAVAEGLSHWWTSTWQSLLQPLVVAWPAVAAAVLVALIVALAARRTGKRLDRDVREPIALFALGVLSFVLAVFPYLAVGKVPQTSGPEWWDSRHQLLVPLAAALIVCSIVLLAGTLLRLKQRSLVLVLFGFLIAFVAADITTCIDYQRDWYKQVSLMRHMASDANVRRGNLFVIRDNTTSLMVNRRRILPYEFSAMAYTVFGEPTRFLVDETLSPRYAAQLPRFLPYEQYHWTGWHQPIDRYQLILDPGTKSLDSDRAVLGLLAREVFAHDKFERIVPSVLAYQSMPMPVDESGN